MTIPMPERRSHTRIRSCAPRAPRAAPRRPARLRSGASSSVDAWSGRGRPGTAGPSRRTAPAATRTGSRPRRPDCRDAAGHSSFCGRHTGPAGPGAAAGSSMPAHRHRSRRLRRSTLDRIMPFVAGSVEPSFQSGNAEADRRAGARVTPFACGQLLQSRAQRALRRRRRQKRADNREAQPRPTLMHPRSVSLRHARPPKMREPTVSALAEGRRRASSAGRWRPSESAHRRCAAGQRTRGSAARR